MKRIEKKVKHTFIPHSENEFQPHILKPQSLFTLAVVLLVIKLLIFSWFFYFPKTTQFAIVTNLRLTELVNEERVKIGLQPLRLSQQLVQAAEAKAQDMLSKDYFAHTSPDGISPWYWLDNVGYKYRAAGENLARNFNDSIYLHQAWMNSPSHKANILNEKYQEMGIAVVEGTMNGRKTVLAVQFFGSGSFVASAKKEAPESKPIAISETNVELPSTEKAVKTETIEIVTEEKTPLTNFSGTISEKSESAAQKFYFIILALISLVLLLTLFVSFRTQHPKTIFTVVIFIILIAAVALFNGQEFLNKAIEII